MSKNKYILFLLMIFALFASPVKAATCSYEERAELNSEISNITASYELLTRFEPTENVPDEILGTPEEENYQMEIDYFQINVLNLTENTYAVITNDYNSDRYIYNYEDTTNGNIALTWDNIMNIVEFTIEIYTSDNTTCEGTLLRTLTVRIPRYNSYARLAMCDSLNDYYLCQEYVTFDEISFGTFEERVRNEIERRETEALEEEKEENGILDFLSQHRTEIIIGVIIVIVIAGGTVVMIKIKRRREII